MSIASVQQRRLAKRKELLGMSFGTARARLERALLYEMAIKLGMDSCFRCSKKIESVAEFSIEHKIGWQLSSDPVQTYFDMANIAFSHRTCNSNAAQKRILPHGVAKSRNCKCAPCLEARNKYNADWMDNWRKNGKDKTRKNYRGPRWGAIIPCKDDGLGS